MGGLEGQSPGEKRVGSLCGSLPKMENILFIYNFHFLTKRGPDRGCQGPEGGVLGSVSGGKRVGSLCGSLPKMENIFNNIFPFF